MKNKRIKKYKPKSIDLTGGIFKLQQIDLSNTYVSKEYSLAEYTRSNNAFIKLKSNTCTTSDFDDLVNGLHLIKELTRFVEVDLDINERYSNVARRLSLVFETAEKVGMYICPPDMFDDIDKLLIYLLKVLPKIYLAEYYTAYSNIKVMIANSKQEL
jgi:hypothetical protein